MLYKFLIPLYKIHYTKYKHMDIKQKKITAIGLKLFIEQDGREIARAYLYLMKNDLHDQPFGFMEDVFVAKELRGRGFGSKLALEVIKQAKKNNCYKLICTSRQSKTKAHELYNKLGFKDWGKEFRIDIL